ncbi:hypothetical protein [Streptomyces sp. NPDC090131]|uniref:hypothetical protein n=1 Tax=Streptomyces sp. NPDC090131 TaxID=3365954 RepID=UPI0038302605
MADTTNEGDTQLATHAAELVSRWVSADTSLTESQGWKLVSLQHPGSGHMEMYVWDDVLAWERELATVLAAADGSPESGERIARARATAVTAMRDMLLRGVPAGETANQSWRRGEGPDPREELRHFVARRTHRWTGRTTGPPSELARSGRRTARTPAPAACRPTVRISRGT